MRTINLYQQNPLPIHEGKYSEKVVSFANNGLRMSDRWWKQTYKLLFNGQLWGVYKTPSGLRRNSLQSS